MITPDDFDLKEFMESEDIPSWLCEHHRIYDVFATAGFSTLYVQRGCLNPVWTVCLSGSNAWARSTQARRVIRTLLENANINVPGDRLTIVPEGLRTRIIFPHNAGDSATRITFLRRKRNRLVRCCEVLRLVEPH